MYSWTLTEDKFLAPYVRRARLERAYAMSHAAYLAVVGTEWLVRGAVAGLAGLFRAARASFQAGRRRRRALAELRGLDNRLLRDIGISRGEIHSVVLALEEANGDRRARGRDYREIADRVPFVRPYKSQPILPRPAEAQTNRRPTRGTLNDNRLSGRVSGAAACG